MADAKINLSLDEIIKNNRKNGAGGKKPGQALGLAARKRQAALLRRQKTQQKGAAMGQNRTAGRNVRGRGQIRAPQRAGQKNALSTFATQKLVQTLVKTPIRGAIGRGRGGNIRGRVALRVGGRGRGGLRIAGRPAAAASTGVKARLGFVAQKNNRFSAVNQRRGLDLQLNTPKTRGRGRGRGGFGRLASDQIVQEQNAIRRQQQSVRRQRVLTTRGRGGRFATGGFSTQGPRFQLVSPSRQQQQQQQFASPRGGRRGRGRASFSVGAAGTSGGFGGSEVRGVRASFSNSQTGTTLNDRFGGGRQEVRVSLKQQRGGRGGRGGFRGRRQIYDY